MQKTKKFECRVIDNDGYWIAEIVRRVTSKKTKVSKSQGGFASEAEAKEWGEKELALFLAKVSEQNKRRSERREQQGD